jgi:NAD(P)-dependent dehydrogenase (short-subunit alcohol dehydrogenase family)
MRTIKQLFDLSGKTALITGGSRGLGLQIAEALGEQGATIVLSARKQAELDEAVAHLASRGIKASAIAADVSQEAAIATLVQEAMQRLGHIDILVNNAGATWGAPAEDHPVEAWDKVIVNIASIAGLSGNGPHSMKTIAYNTSKGAVVNFTRTLAGEWGRHGITVNAIAPGFFPSKMTKGILENLGEDTIAQKAPLLRIGDDEDLKGAALLFASDAGKHITGQILAVDGGVSAVH